MKPITINKESVIYKIAKMGLLNYDDEDICAFTKAFVRGLMVLVLISAVVIMLSFIAVDFILWAAFSIYFGFLDPDAGAGIGMILFLLGIVIGISFLLSKTREGLSETVTYKMIESKFSKFCVPVEYKE